MNLLARGAAYLQNQMIRVASVEIVYVRPGKQPVRGRAIAGQLVTDNENVNGFVVRSVTRDFTISQTLLTDAGLGKPLRNDEIWQRINGVDHVFVVNGDSFATGHYEESDTYGVAYRIHTRKDREE